MTSDSRSRNSDRQKVSIDKWNQEGTDLPVSIAEPEKRSHDHHLAAHFGPEPADQAGAYHQLSYDHPSIYQGDQYQGHHSSVSHPPHGGHSPARHYDPYDLSPAYLGTYPDESANPSTQFGSYAAAGAGHVHDSYDTSGHQYSYADQKQARLPNAENSYISDDHERSYLEPSRLTWDKAYHHERLHMVTCTTFSMISPPFSSGHLKTPAPLTLGFSKATQAKTSNSMVRVTGARTATEGASHISHP